MFGLIESVGLMGHWRGDSKWAQSLGRESEVQRRKLVCDRDLGVVSE